LRHGKDEMPGFIGNMRLKLRKKISSGTHPAGNNG
jgi:hypothetical protein